MQTGWPMPFANTGLAAPNNFTNSAGIYELDERHRDHHPGRPLRAHQSTPAAAIERSSATGTHQPGRDQQPARLHVGRRAPPATRRPRARRFYEVNKLAEQARGWLPGNTWLQSAADRRT